MENLSGGDCDCDCDCCDCDCDCDGGKTKSTPSLLAFGLGWSLTTENPELKKEMEKLKLADKIYRYISVQYCSIHAPLL